jgi:xanthine phosphoribosyltransferase
MQILKERIQCEGRHLGNGVVKVDSFMNHQIDPELMKRCGEELARRFAHVNATRIITAETSGIAPALAAGMFLKIPVVFARKHQPITMKADPYRESSSSPTHKKQVELLVSAEYLLPSDRVLLIDDFLSSANTTRALVKLIEQGKATLVGIGVVIEKVYAGGRDSLKDLFVPIESLAAIESFDGDRLVLCDEVKMASLPGLVATKLAG